MFILRSYNLNPVRFLGLKQNRQPLLFIASNILVIRGYNSENGSLK